MSTIVVDGRTLSNTDAPKYYAGFREAVKRGDIPVCREISMEMNRIDELIANPKFYVDQEAVEGFVRFCEGEMVLVDGRPLKLLPIFKVWAEQIFGWYYWVERTVYVPSPGDHGGHYELKRELKRLINKQYLIVARGAAKSMYAALIQAYFLCVDTSTTKQITTAPTMKQAEEVVSPIATAITLARGPLFQFLTEGSLQNTTGARMNRQQLAHTKKGIENFLTNSILEIRPMSINKLQGLRPKVSTVDEWLSGDLREDVVGAIQQGAGKVPDYLIVAISSEGTVRNGAGDTIKMELMSVLKGDYYDPHRSIWHYRLDDLEEVADPAMWLKANPNLDLTISYDEYHQDVERAEKAPATRNDIIAKRFGIPMEGFTYFFSYDDTIPHRKREFWQMPCAMGVDLSMGDDFCAFTFLFPLPRGRFGVKARSYITGLTLKKLPGALREKYEQFIEEGSLMVFENDQVLDLMDVYDDLMRWIDEQQYDVRCVGYDPYAAKEFIARYEQDQGGPHGIVKVIQGKRTESVPLGQLKILAEERLLLFDEAIMQYCIGNAMVVIDLNGQKMLWKQRQDEKIDNVSALMDAWIAFNLNKEDFE